jgi:hypothetical protein
MRTLPVIGRSGALRKACRQSTRNYPPGALRSRLTKCVGDETVEHARGFIFLVKRLRFAHGTK